MKLSALGVSIVALLVLVFSTPLVIHAQTGDDLRATVRAAILADPRTAELSEANIEAMVIALTAEAAAHGITSEDITWRPQEGEAAGVVGCGNLPAFLCTVNQAFGFDGSDPTIPVGLVVTSGLLLFLIGSILLHKHGHHPIAGRLSTSSLQ